MARKSDVPMSEPAKRTKRKRIWEDNDGEATPPPSAQRVKIKDRLSINQLSNDKGESENGAYTQGSTPSETPSGKTKRTNRGKHLPPGFRPGHVSSTNDKRTGLFSPEEIEALEQYKLWFCNYYHITADVFDASIQSAKSSKNGIFLQDRPPVDERSFWQEIYGQIPDRDRRSIARFCRRHFSNAYKPHQWTTADDDELERLHSMYGTKWAIIARDMERTYDDVVQRWKNKVEHRHTMKMGPWDDDEIDKLIQNLEDTRKAWLRLGRTKEDIGKDIYELPDELIAWGKISERFEHTRSRQQVADKWRKIKRIVLERRADGYEDAVWESSLQPKGGKRSKSRPVSVESEKRVFISNEMVDSSDEDEDQNKKETEDGKKKRSAKANGTSQPKVNEKVNESADESTDESSDASSEDDSDDSSSDEKSKAAKNSDKDDEDDVVDESAGDETPLPKTNGYHAASDNESVVPESQAEESEASPSRSSSPEAETNGHTAAKGRQPSEELGLDPVSAPEAPEVTKADKDTRASEEEEEEEEDDDDDDDDEEGSESADQEVLKPLTTSSQPKPSPASSPAKPTKLHLIKQEEKHSSRPHDSGSESESDDDESHGRSSSGSGSDDDDDDDEEGDDEEELSPEEIEKKIFKFKQEPEDD
ncbi:uncharacterized protein BHQ10_001392 [Talaromyces amestolkiae]|uniref:Myb-like domain-containing protein n=1 Tax=Talaromyces amestolkiae TaxID=1196081 RepID=A0A364KP99_TALAM|nr:uncharacterized protein BHQ10_001392 [Talaromyces amestolkiae]RAO65380.1 hypothetical protein BHQ10_001392 [Talaromyces amestolkiae]